MGSLLWYVNGLLLALPCWLFSVVIVPLFQTLTTWPDVDIVPVLFMVVIVAPNWFRIAKLNPELPEVDNVPLLLIVVRVPALSIA